MKVIGVYGTRSPAFHLWEIAQTSWDSLSITRPRRTSRIVRYMLRERERDIHSTSEMPLTQVRLSVNLAGSLRQALFDSIPLKYRPAFDISDAGTEIRSSLFNSTTKALGSTFLPFLLTNGDTNETVRLVLHAYIVPNLLTGVFIGMNGLTSFSWSSLYSLAGPVFTFGFHGESYRFFGI